MSRIGYSGFPWKSASHGLLNVGNFHIESFYTVQVVGFLSSCTYRKTDDLLVIPVWRLNENSRVFQGKLMIFGLGAAVLEN